MIKDLTDFESTIEGAGREPWSITICSVNITTISTDSAVLH